MGEKREKTGESRRFFKVALMLIRDSVIAVLLSTLVAVVVNIARPQGIPLIAEEPYEILVPCPEPGGEVMTMSISDPTLRAASTFLVDARAAQEFASWRFRDAANLTFDYLDPTPKEQIQALARAIAASGANRVVVYGDGGVPDTGEQLGREISGYGIKNVFYLKGGAKALQSADVPRSQ